MQNVNDRALSHCTARLRSRIFDASMRVLLTIPHFFNAEASGEHGSLRLNPQPRIEALATCLRSLHATFGSSQFYYSHDEDNDRLVQNPPTKRHEYISTSSFAR
ncbi:MAG: hypothetical protein J7641_14720 [Cyanobacteria bacterium SID2]|nr:hypothetical protein [Cyanobacteria bacterium SID2]MBP0006791.1 hypothetical protein [Cyanobacteria bacterium SBC]